MSQPGTMRAILGGALQIAAAFRRWPSHPRRGDVLRALAGPWPVLILLAASLLAVALGIAVQEGWRYLLGLPPFIFLHFLPSTIRESLIAPTSLFAYAAVWRVRSIRRSERLRSIAGEELFELSSVPLLVAALLVAVLLAAVPHAVPFVSDGVVEDRLAAVAGLEPDASAPPWSEQALSAVRQLAVVALILAFLGSAPRLGKGIGSLIGALFIVFGLEFGVAFAASAAGSAFSWLPWSWASDSPRWLLRVALYAAIAGFAWTRAREIWHAGRPVPHAPSPTPPPIPQRSEDSKAR